MEMNEQREVLFTDKQINRTVDEVTRITGELYQKLKNTRLSAETMAEVLAEYRPGMTAAQLRDISLILRQGVMNGQRSYQEMEKQVKENSDLVYQIHKTTQGMDRISKREFLLLLYKSICRLNGYPLSPEHAAFLDSMSVEQLTAEDAELLEQQCVANSRTLITTLKGRFDADSTVSALRWNDARAAYSDTENAWILAAGFYAAGDRESVVNINPLSLAERVGCHTEAMSAAKRGLRQSGLVTAGVPAVMFLSINIASMWAVSASMEGVIGGTSGFLHGIGLFAAESAIPDTLAVVFGSVVFMPAAVGLGLALSVWAVEKFVNWLDSGEKQNPRTLQEHLESNEREAGLYLPQDEEYEWESNDESGVTV